MSKRRRRIIAAIAVLAAYLGVYAAASSRGQWRWSQTGELRYAGSVAVTDVERWHPAGMHWERYIDATGRGTSRGDWIGYLFSPLIALDRAWVHADRRISAGFVEGRAVSAR